MTFSLSLTRHSRSVDNWILDAATEARSMRTQKTSLKKTSLCAGSKSIHHSCKTLGKGTKAFHFI